MRLPLCVQIIPRIAAALALISTALCILYPCIVTSRSLKLLFVAPLIGSWQGSENRARIKRDGAISGRGASETIRRQRLRTSFLEKLVKLNEVSSGWIALYRCSLLGCRRRGLEEAAANLGRRRARRATLLLLGRHTPFGSLRPRADAYTRLWCCGRPLAGVLDFMARSRLFLVGPWGLSR